MPLSSRPLRFADPASLDRELEALQQVVATARRNRWHGGDIIEPEFENFLAALTGSVRPTDTAPAPVVERRNSWREILHEVG